MTKTERIAKNKQISQTMAETRKRHSSMLCRTYTCKVHYKSLSKEQKESIEKLFLEAKWFKNYILGWSGFRSDDEEYKKTHNIFKFPAQETKDITKKDRDGNDVTVKISLHTMIKSQLHQDILSNIKTVSTLKKKGYQKRGGTLKFKKECNYIPLKKYGYTHRIKSLHRVVIAGIGRKGLPVNGLDQFINIPGIEFANARLIRKADGIFIQFICYIPKENKKQEKINKTLGIDFGCETSFTTSEGEKIKATVEESERLKNLSKKNNRRLIKAFNKKYGRNPNFKNKKDRQKFKKLNRSNNWCKTNLQIQKEYQKITNRKNDLANKLVHKFCQYETVVIQDEQLQNWKKNGHGKAVQHSVLGRVKAKLKLKPNVVILGKSVPTTKLCTKCGVFHDELKIWNRTFNCDCGVSEDRDIHAAKNMVWFYENKVGVERTNFKRVEMEAIVSKVLESLEIGNNERTSFSEEALSMKHEDATSLV